MPGTELAQRLIPRPIRQGKLRDLHRLWTGDHSGSEAEHFTLRQIGVEQRADTSENTSQPTDSIGRLNLIYNSAD